MKKIMKILSMTIVYFVLISLLPTGIIKASATEGIPKYLNYTPLKEITSATQYKDQTLVAYNVKDCNYGYNYDFNYGYSKVISKQVSLFKNNTETKIKQFNYEELLDQVLSNKLINDKMFYTVFNKNSTPFNLSAWYYDFNNGDSGYSTYSDYIAPEAKMDIINKIKEKYNYDLDARYSNFFYFYTIKDNLGNDYQEIFITTQTTEFYVIYNKDNCFIQENNSSLVPFYDYFDNDNNLVTKDYNYNNIIKFKNNIVTNYKVNYIDINSEEILTFNSEYVFTIDYFTGEIRRYALKDGSYNFDKNILNGANALNFARDNTKGNLWFIEKEQDGTFVCKFENGEAIRKYQVNDNMTYLKVYDDNHLVVYSNGIGFTAINSNQQENTVAPTVNSQNGTTTAVITELTPNSNNTIKVNNTDPHVAVVLNDVQAIANGTGSLSITLSNDTVINLPFSAIDKSLLTGAKSVQVELNPIANSDIVKGLKAVNKVFDLNLVINYADNSVKSIHKFANGTAQITLSLTDDELKGLDKSKLKVFYYNEETKKYEMMETTVDGNKITFTTSHFSKFIVAEATNNAPTTTNTIASAVATKTGDMNKGINVIALGAFALASLGVISLLTYKKMRKNSFKK